MKKAVTRQPGFLLLLCCCVLLACAGCRDDSQGRGGKVEFEIDESYDRGVVSVHKRVDKGSLTIAQTLLLELEATMQDGYEVKMPKIDTLLKDFGIVDWDNLGDRLDQNENVVRTYRYRLEPFLSGEYELPSLTFEFYDVNDPNAVMQKLATEPIPIEVTSLLGEDRAALVIEDIEDVVEMPKEASLWWIWLLVVIALISATAVVLVFRKKRLAKLIRIFQPAHEIAYTRLRTLVREDLIAAGKIKEFYEKISSILRHYIEHRFELRAPERTTEEFLVELQHTDVLSESDKTSLGEFLTHCDLVKFAKHAPTNVQIQQTFNLVKEFIEKTKSDEHKIDVTDRTETGNPAEAEVA
ncbi:MAG: hypothetical protein ACYS8Z_06845 [Planctomycetota bacterium]|jgi:hypothetical protein